MFTFFKRTLILSAGIVGLLGFLLSCENPFSNNLGEKVTVEPPTITVETPEHTGLYLKGTVEFSGKVTAYRELRRVEVKIHNSEQGQEDHPILDWTDAGIIFNGTGAKEGTWSYNLNTLRQLFASRPTKEGLDDGILKIQFRVHDVTTYADTIELIYIIKNRASDIKMTFPNHTPNAPTARIITGQQLRGQVTDRKGLKPGYPQIKFWPSNLAGGEPDDDDTNWGYASMYLVGFDRPGGVEGNKQGVYADRTKIDDPIRVAQFVFNLVGYTIDSNTRQIVYSLDVNGEYIPLPPGIVYYFKIKTSDTYFDEATGLPREPDPEKGEVEAIGYFPPAHFGEFDENSFEEADHPVSILVVGNQVVPTVKLDFDGFPANIETQPNPHYYITEPTSKKIAVKDTSGAHRPDFVLQILADHTEEPIDFATLFYLHESTGRFGYLKWDDAAGGVWVSDREGETTVGDTSTAAEAKRAEMGYTGRTKAGSNYGRLFTYSSTDTNGGHAIFTPSTEPYIFEITAQSTGESRNFPPQRYVLYLDGKGPEVRITSIRGSSKEPAAGPAEATDAAQILTDEYVVNGNIQVGLTRIDDSGIMAYEAGLGGTLAVKPPAGVVSMVKWVVETAVPVPTGTSTTLGKLETYREDPSAANLAFFYENIAKSGDHMSGWVRDPLGSSAPANASPQDQMYNLKFNTRNEVAGANTWDGQYLYLYIIAMDNVHNLGYIVQRLKVDDLQDAPHMDISAFSTKNANGTTIAGPAHLEVEVNKVGGAIVRGNGTDNWGTDSPRANILEMGQGIEMNFTDWDGININSTPPGILITVSYTGNQAANAQVTLTSAQLGQFLNGDPRDLSGTLTQRIMAAALWPTVNPPLDHLYDGMYRIQIGVTDDVGAKVTIDGTRPGDTPSAATAEPENYYFAVYNEQPQIMVSNPPEEQLQTEKPVTVSGYARSRLNIQKMWITFTPEVSISPSQDPAVAPASSQLTLTLVPTTHAEYRAGYYTYSWEKTGVIFNPIDAGYTTDNRRFRVEAYDRLGYGAFMDRTVKVDTEPPEAFLISFNNYRDEGQTHGKVPIVLSVTDNNGLKVFDDPDEPGYDPANPANPLMGVKWWILPEAEAAPTWGRAFPNSTGTNQYVNGIGRQFRQSDAQGGSRFEITIDTRIFSDPAISSYRLFVAAIDKAGNILDATTNTVFPGSKPYVPLVTFKVDQDADYPYLTDGSIRPLSGTTTPTSVVGASPLSITGTVGDYDLFDPAKVNSYVEIRFPRNVAYDGVGDPNWNDNDWMPVSGTLNAAKDIDFEYKLDAILNTGNPLIDAYFGTYPDYKDANKYYQIRVTDEAAPDLSGSNYHWGKNPNNPAPVPNLGTIGTKSKIFPSDTGHFSFIFDNAPPEITFANYDPQPGHYIGDNIRPTYSTFDQLWRDLTWDEGAGVARGGTVFDGNLDFFEMTFEGLTARLVTAGTGIQNWTLADKPDPVAEIIAAGNVADIPAAWTKTDMGTLYARLKEIFDLAEDGFKTIGFEARDITSSGNPVRPTWNFYKDTEGPEIIVNTPLVRAIKYNGFTIVPGDPPTVTTTLVPSMFPANWNEIWPYGNTTWQTSSAWLDLRNHGLASWPLEYGHPSLSVTDVIEKLKADHLATYAPGVVSDSRNTDAGGNPLAILRGRFQDSTSYIRVSDNDTYFYYRFNSSGRTATAVDNVSGWHVGTIPSGTNATSVSFQIPINSLFTGVDGPNTVDIKLKDSAGNWAEIYGLQFILDRANPFVYGMDGTPPIYDPGAQDNSDGFRITRPAGITEDALPPGTPTWTNYEENERVFSEEDNLESVVFWLRGRVYDINLSEVTATITQDSGETFTPYNIYQTVDTKNVAADVPKTNASTTETNRLLSVEPGSVTGEYIVTVAVRRKNIWRLLDTNDNESAKRYVTIQGTDMAGRKSGVVRWYFYIDSTSPKIEFTNLEKGHAGTGNLTGLTTGYTIFDGAVSLMGVVSDETKVNEIKYVIGKWDYAANSGAGAWRWYGGASWNLTAPPAVTAWPSAHADGYDAAHAQPTVNWTITGAMLNAAYPGIAGEQGQYRIDVYATDFSLGGGNPNNTYLVDDSTFSDVSGTSGRKFFIDTASPEVTLAAGMGTYFSLDMSGSPSAGPGYNPLYGRADFTITVSDANTIWKIFADVLDDKGDSVFTGGAFPVTFTPGATLTNPFTVDVRPYMLNTGGVPLDLVGAGPNDPPVAYTLKLYVYDAAGRVSTSSDTTKQFILDNRPPKLDNIQPETWYNKDNHSEGYRAITGRITMKGNSEDNSSLVRRVAYYVENIDDGFGNVPAVTDMTKWRYYQDAPGSTTHQLFYRNAANQPQVLMQIERGIFAWEVFIPNTRNFGTTDGLKYIEGGFKPIVKTGGSSDYVEGNYKYANGIFEKDIIPEGEEIGKMVIHFLAIDDAGNPVTERMEYYIYPEGDRPVVTAIRNPNQEVIEAERLLNGSIRISGQARDNERVKYVYFRVLNDNAGDPGTPGHSANPAYGYPYVLAVPRWDTATWDQVTGNQTPLSSSYFTNMMKSSTDIAVGDGWYMANRGGNSSTSTSWWVIVNTGGELERSNIIGPNRIRIEVRVEDDTRNAAGTDWTATTGTWTGASVPWTGEPGMLSRVKPDDPEDKASVIAFVATDAPSFEDEEIAFGRSADADNPGMPSIFWDKIADTNIRGVASYRITVKDDNGVRGIRWTRTTVNTSGGLSFSPNNTSSENLLDGTYGPGIGSQYSDDFSIRGIAASAKPHPSWLRTNITLDSAKTYIVWKWHNDLASSGIAEFSGLSSTDADFMRFTVITNSSANIGNAEVIERTNGLANPNDNNYFLWVVCVDIDTAKLGLGAEPSVNYPIYLSATDISRPSPLTSSYVSYLPIDERAPTAAYTFNRRPAGTSVPLGGEAGDDGPVAGVRRVVLWFSRLGDGTPGSRPRSFISWHQNDVNDLGVGTFVPHTAALPPGEVDWAANLRGSVIPATTYNGGHAMQTPFIPGWGDPNGTTALDGPSAIVIDRNRPSGNDSHHGHNLPMGFAAGGNLGIRWYVEINSYGMDSGPVLMHVVVFDKAGNARYYEEPLVIMNNAPRIQHIQLGTDIRNIPGFAADFPSNERLATGTTTSGRLLDRIRARLKYPADHRNTSLQDEPLPDVLNGVSDPIYSNALDVRNIVDFNVRNKLMAMRIQTTGVPQATKTRNFRLEYVSNATSMDTLTVRAGRVYIIDNPGSNMTWASLGAEGSGPWPSGYAFLAVTDGKNNDGSPKATAQTPTGAPDGTVWELNTSYYNGSNVWTASQVPSNLQLGDATYSTTGDSNAVSAEFAYAAGAFGDVPGTTIIDFGGSDAWPPAQGATANTVIANHSMFILKIIDGYEEDLFMDFALIRIRVNNEDRTVPFAQLYDLNPKTEGQGQSWNVQRAATPMSVGEGPQGNRVMGGLHNASGEKSGHIEPRRINLPTAPYNSYNHSLTSLQMGGLPNKPASANADPTVAWANPVAFFAADTVSGTVILRGYAEDDQRIGRVALNIGGTTFDILTTRTGNGLDDYTDGTPTTFVPPRTGFLQVAAGTPANKVFFTDTIDLYRHRVEWAYVWDTETLPAGVVVGNVAVRAITYNYIVDSPNVTYPASTLPANVSSNWNPSLPAGLARYNEITMNLRPYVTGFIRDKSQFRHDNRSLQGRYMFYRGGVTGQAGEQVAIKGFNLGGGAVTDTSVILPTKTAPTTVSVAANGIPGAGNYGITDAITANRYRLMSAIPADAATGNGTLLLTAAAGPTYYAANTRIGGTGGGTGDRPLVNATGTAVDNSAAGRRWVQPWNLENTEAAGTELWDDFTSVHIWQSNDSRTGNDQGAFRTLNSRGTNIINPAMSVDPRSGVLWESHAEGGNAGVNGTNTGHMSVSRNNADWGSGDYSNIWTVLRFIDPIFMTDIYFSGGDGSSSNSNRSAHPFAAASVIGRNGTLQTWDGLGGVYIWGAGGLVTGISSSVTPSNVSTGSTIATGHYLGEKTWYNASTGSTGVVNPPTTDQFENPHVVTWLPTGTGGEHIHLSYYDTKDKSIKYRYNLRGSPGPINTSNAAELRTWINLDGGWDAEDQNTGTNVTVPYTLYELTGGVIIPDQNLYVREVLVANNATVQANTLVYRLGPSDLNVTGPITEVYAARQGTISLSYTTAQRGDQNVTLNSAVGGVALTGTATNATLAAHATWVDPSTGLEVAAGTIPANTTQTTFSVTQANNGTALTNNTNNYLREVYVSATSYVKKGDIMFVFGRAAETNTNDRVVIRAPYDGQLNRMMNTNNATGNITAGTITVPATGTVGNRTFTYVRPTGNELFRIVPMRADYIRDRKANLANNQWVEQGELLYQYGASAENATITTAAGVQPRTVYRLRSPASGIITNAAAFTATGTAPNRAFGTTAPTLTSGRQFTVTTSGYQWLRSIGPDVGNGATVTEGQLIYTFGVQGTANTTDTTYEVRAPFAGVLSNLFATTVGTNATNYTYTTRPGSADTNANNNTNTLFRIQGGYINHVPMQSQVYTITYASASEAPYQRIVNAASRPTPRVDAGLHNAISVTSQGQPIVAYYDNTNARLKLAISTSATPTSAYNWRTYDAISDAFSLYRNGTGQYVSIKVDQRLTTGNENRVHIAALSARNKKLVYIRGRVNIAASTWTVDTVQMVDNIGDVGRWCSLSLDSNGNPWIAYQDEGYDGSRDGVKLAYRPTNTNNVLTDPVFTKYLEDRNGAEITGWETMHIPTRYAVFNARVGLECFPVRNWTPAISDPPFWGAAVSYLSNDLYRIVYYAK